MKKIQQWLQLAGLLVGSSAVMATAESQGQDSTTDMKSQEQSPSAQLSSTLKVKVSAWTLMSYDLKNFYAEPNFSPATVPMKEDGENKKRLSFRLTRSLLGVEKTLPLSKSSKETLKLALEAQIQKDPSVSKAYGDFRGFRIGKDLTNFYDPDACDLVGCRSVQVRWSYPLTPLFSLALAAEEAPDLEVYSKKGKDKNSKESEKKQLPTPYKNIPAFTAHIRVKQDQLWHVQLGGLMRVSEYRDTKKGKDVYLPTWGASLGTSYHLIPGETVFKIQGVYGQGIGSYMTNLQDLNSEKEANSVYSAANGELKTLDAWGVGAGISHNWLPILKSEVEYTVMVSMIDEKILSEAYRYGQGISAGVAYLPIDQFELELKYLVGIRKNISEKQKDAHRVQATAKFSL